MEDGFLSFLFFPPCLFFVFRMEAQQRLNFSQKRKEIQQWLRAMINAEPLFKGCEPGVIHSLAMRCKFKAYPKRVALILEEVIWCRCVPFIHFFVLSNFPELQCFLYEKGCWRNQ